MLQIKEISKKYVTGELVQTALDSVSLQLRDNEFVAILGPSGSGKTTLLNVIGGLDRYDSGDLVINGISTKKYSDRDWDSYRNHTIGFVFQSYNLIPHQSVLANVELALTISGISGGERRRRAAQALEAVGLGNQLHKRPNQMSGGQMQRVAIARALVNDPDILLADEPTGALDSETSVQVMELLKEVSRDRLVVMVTHNPELAEEYANRIVRVKDGRIIGDTNPCVEADDRPTEHKNMGKATMSFLTALSLSFNNLLTKKARTLLTAFAGSIGIIGIALIMSLSTGFQKYIDKIQTDTLSNYPLTIQTETSDLSSMFSAFGTTMQAANEADPDTVVEQQMLSQMFAQIGTNDLASFKTYLENHYDEIGHTITTIQYGYSIAPRIYCEDMRFGIVQANPSTLFNRIMGNSAMSMLMNSNVFYEMIDNFELLDSQYEVLKGKWPESYDEMVVVLQNRSQITDYMAYSLGLKDPKELDELMRIVVSGEEVEEVVAFSQWGYEDLMNVKLRLVNAGDLYQYNTEYNVWEDMTDDEAYMQQKIAAGQPLKIVGIVCAREGANATALSAGVAYTSALTKKVIEAAAESEIVQMQLENESINVFTGAAFNEKSDSSLNFEDMITVDQQAISSAFGMNISMDSIKELLSDFLSDSSNSLNIDTSAARSDFKAALAALGTEMLERYIAANGGGEVVLYLTDAQEIVDDFLATPGASDIIHALARKYGMNANDLDVFSPLLVGMITDYVARELVIPDVEIPEPTLPPTLDAEPTEGTEPTEEAEPTEAAPEETAPEATELPETAPPETLPEETPPDVTEPAETVGAETTPAPTEAPEAQPPISAPSDSPDVPDAPEEGSVKTLTIAPETISALISEEDIAGAVETYVNSAVVKAASSVVSMQMMRYTIERKINAKLSEFGDLLGKYIGSAFYVNTEQLANAFQFNMDEQELQRLMLAMSGQTSEQSVKANLVTLGYADLAVPTAMSIYLRDFETKEEFTDFLDAYNERMKLYNMEDYVIRYTDMTGIMMSSVRTIIDSVSYALIAFVAVSLVVSSIMIGIITYISVMERTKEIGVLRAIGASKRNISQVFNAETFIIGLCSGLIGIGVTLLLLIPGNAIIRHLTNNPDIVAQLPVQNALLLILLSMVLTLIGGFIPAKQAAKKDPVIALRSE